MFLMKITKTLFFLQTARHWSLYWERNMFYNLNERVRSMVTRVSLLGGAFDGYFLV